MPVAAALGAIFLKSLGLTPDGKCERHPDITIFIPSSDDEDGYGGSLQECECCSKDQQERLKQSVGDITTTSITADVVGGTSSPRSSNSRRRIAGQTYKRTQTGPGGSSVGTSESNKIWIDSVNTRLIQFQELKTGMPSPHNRYFMEDHSGQSARESHSSFSMNPILNISMKAVAEEPDNRTALRVSETSPGTSTNPTPLQWRHLEEHVQLQEESIQSLKRTVEQQEATIRQDLDRLTQLVSTVAQNQRVQLEQQQGQHHHEDKNSQHQQHPRRRSSGENQSITGNVRETAGLPTVTPVVSNAIAIATAAVPSSSRPTMYNKKLQHPANIFTSVRTIERRPPKPPLRHGSFSTHTHTSRRTSVDSSKLASIVSSMENSTYNETTNNDTVAPTDSGNNNEENESIYDIALESGFGPGVESMLENQRSKPLDIIFDASAAISTEFQLGDDEGNKEEEKKTSSGNDSAVSLEATEGSPSADGAFCQKTPLRESFQKMSGSIRLEIPEEEDSAQSDEDDVKLSAAASSLFQAAPEMPPVPLTDKSPTNGRFFKRIFPPPNSAAKLRQPQREKSESNIHHPSEKIAPATKSGRVTPARSRNLTHPNIRKQYVPPSPITKIEDISDSPRTTGLLRLNMRNLAKLGKNTAPPRREIFAMGTSKLQISSLTIDTSLLSDCEPARPACKIPAPLSVREVTNYPLRDKFGDKGLYTGTVRIDANGRQEEQKQGDTDSKATGEGVAHGLGTMQYDEGRCYRGEWRDGHWHGSGFLENANGDSYQGDFVYDARHGHGIYRYGNGDIYEGDFTEDKRSGKGVFNFHNGSVYRGDFVR